MKKSVSKSYLAIAVFLILILTIQFIITQIDDDSFIYGNEFEKYYLGKTSTGVRDKMIEDNPERFITGLLASPESKQKFIESWFENDLNSPDKTPYISDASKTILFKKIYEKDKDFALEILQQSITKIQQTAPQHYDKFYRGKITTLDINPAILENLKWKENTLTIQDEEGKTKAFLDFDNPPKFIREILIQQKSEEDDTSQFAIISDDGTAKKTIKFDSGSIDEELRVLRPDGTKFGSINSGIKSVELENNNLQIQYYDINGQVKQTSISQDELQQDKFQEIIKILKPQLESDTQMDFVTIQKILTQEQTKTIITELLNNIQDLKLDSITPNAISFGYRRKDRKAQDETIEFSFDENQELNIKASEHATVVSTNSKQEPDLVLNSNQELEADSEFLFNKHGELLAHKNTEAIIFDSDGYESITFKSEKVMIGTTIVKSSLADVISKIGFEEFLDADGRISSEKIQAVLKGETPLTDETSKRAIEKFLALLEKDTKMFEHLIAREPVDTQAEIIAFLKEHLKNPELQITTKNRIQDTLDVLKKNLILSTEKTLIGMLGDGGRERWDKLLENEGVKLLLDEAQEQTEKALSTLTTPQNLQILTNYYNNPEDSNAKDAFNKLIQTALTQHVQDYDVLYSSGAFEQIKTKIQENLQGISSPDSEFNLENKIQTKINDLITSTKFTDFIQQTLETSKSEGITEESLATTLQTKIRGEVEQGIRDFIEDKPKLELTDEEITQITETLYPKADAKSTAQAFIAIYNQAKTEVENEKENFITSLKTDLEKLRQPRFETHLLIDVELGDIVYTGNQKAEVDTKIPLRQVKVQNTGSEDNAFTLKSNGNIIAQFIDKETKISRTTTGLVAGIDLIINENAQGNNKLKLVSRGNTYELYDLGNPTRVKVSRDQGTATVTGIPILGEIPLIASELEITTSKDIKDIGADPNAEIRITNIAQGNMGGLIGWIVNLVVQYQAGKKPQDLSGFVSSFNTQLDAQANEARKISGFEEQIVEGEEFIKFVEINNIEVPNNQRKELEDSLYMGRRILNDPSNNAFKAEFLPIINFLASQQLPHHQSIVFTNNGVSVAGNSFNGGNPNKVAYRMIMREIEKNKELAISHKYVDMQGNIVSQGTFGTQGNSQNQGGGCILCNLFRNL